jgi:predicted RNA-binding protein associated with RNAse of E/G family
MIHLTKAPRPCVSYPSTVLSDDGDRISVLAPWTSPPAYDLGYVVFEAGDVFTEHFWRSRWYSVKRVDAPDGSTKGWYCDICRPAVLTDGTLHAVDLHLDLWLSGDRGTLAVLDEDEFADSGIEQRSPETAARARAALADLHELARSTGLSEF